MQAIERGVRAAARRRTATRSGSTRRSTRGIQAVARRAGDGALDPESRRLVERHLTEMTVAGAGLDEDAKASLRELNERLADARRPRFEKQLLADTNDLAVLVDDVAAARRPDGRERSRRRPRRPSEHGHDGTWLLTLVLPTGHPHLASLTDRGPARSPPRGAGRPRQPRQRQRHQGARARDRPAPRRAGPAARLRHARRRGARRLHGAHARARHGPARTTRPAAAAQHRGRAGAARGARPATRSRRTTGPSGPSGCVRRRTPSTSPRCGPTSRPSGCSRTASSSRPSGSTA